MIPIRLAIGIAGEKNELVIAIFPIKPYLRAGL